MELLAAGGFALGPGRIVIDDRLDRVLPTVLEEYGSRVGIIAGQIGYPLLVEQVGEGWGTDVTIEYLTGHCTATRVDELAAWAADREVIIGVGGGKVLDIAKAAASSARLPVLTIPTSAATCACAATLSVLYTEDGAFAGARQVATVAQLLMPRQIIRAAPPRLLIAGVFDALAKLPELEWQLRELNLTEQQLPWPAQLARATATDVYDLLITKLLTWQEQGFGLGEGPWRESFADNQSVLAVTVGAALVTGTQPPTHPGIAHALYYQHRNRIGDPELLHGEVVAIGILLQLMFNEAPAEKIEQFRQLLVTYNLPTVLDERVVDNLDEEFLTVWAQLCHADPADLAAAIERLE